MQMNLCNYLFFMLYHFTSEVKSHFLFTDFRILSCLLCNVYVFFRFTIMNAGSAGRPLKKLRQSVLSFGTSRRVPNQKHETPGADLG